MSAFLKLEAHEGEGEDDGDFTAANAEEEEEADGDGVVDGLFNEGDITKADRSAHHLRVNAKRRMQEEAEEGDLEALEEHYHEVARHQNGASSAADAARSRALESRRIAREAAAALDAPF